MWTAGAPPSGPRGLGGGRGAARLTANFPPIDAKANFFGAHGNVVSGAISLAAGAGPQTLLELPGGRMTVTAVVVDRDNSTEVTVNNGTDVPLQAARDLDGIASSISLAADGPTTIGLPGAGSGVHRLHLQILPNGPAFPDVVSLLITAEHSSIAGQAFVSET